MENQMIGWHCIESVSIKYRKQIFRAKFYMADKAKTIFKIPCIFTAFMLY